MNLVLSSRTAWIAGRASVLASTYHWSVRKGSITTFERSPCGTMCVFGSIFSRSPAVSRRSTTRRPALQERVIAFEVELRLGGEHAHLRQVVALADFEVVEVMRRRDLHRAR